MGWGSDVTWKRSSALGGTLILLGDAAQLLHPLCPVARKTPEVSPNSTPSSTPNAKRGECRPRAGMASDFCYVATGWSGLGLGQWGMGEERDPAGGSRVARAEMELAGGSIAAPGRGGVGREAGRSLGKPMAG